jgi:hypothetical protein
MSIMTTTPMTAPTIARTGVPERESGVGTIDGVGGGVGRGGEPGALPASR